jgi:phthalate 4,5-dioxygenase oxygenase subunit
MGPIADRTSEKLCLSDIAVVQFRRIMLKALARFDAGEPPIGLIEPHLPTASLRSFQGLVPKGEDWRLLGASEQERAYMRGLGGEPRQAKVGAVA